VVISKGAANKQLAPPRQKACAATDYVTYVNYIVVTSMYLFVLKAAGSVHTYRSVVQGSYEQIRNYEMGNT